MLHMLYTIVLNDINYSEQMLCKHSLLIISSSTWTHYFAAVSVLIRDILYNLNGLDVYTLCTVHEQDLVVARYIWTNDTVLVLLLTCYTTCNVYMYTLLTSSYLVKFLEQLTCEC